MHANVSHPRRVGRGGSYLFTEETLFSADLGRTPQLEVIFAGVFGIKLACACVRKSANIRKSTNQHVHFVFVSALKSMWIATAVFRLRA